MNNAVSLVAAARTTIIPRATDPSAFTRFRATKRFSSLDGWRALAIIAVIFHHSISTGFQSAAAAEGRHGVTLFFVISGFLIVTIMLRSQESPEGFSLTRFWWRRILRIWPIYYATLGIYCLLVGLTDRSTAGWEFFNNLPYFATFTSNFLDPHERTIFFFSWSLAAEEQFYLLWPLVEVLIRRPGPKLLLLGFLIVSSQLALARPDLTATSMLLQVTYNVPLGIMLGTGLAHLLNLPGSFDLLYRVFGRRGSAAACAGFAVFVGYVSPAMEFSGELLVALALTMVVIATVIREDNDLRALLTWRPIAWIGTVSYGMYMFHMLSVNAVRKGASVIGLDEPLVIFVGSVALACAIASISFLYYERPFLRLKDRFFHDPLQSPRGAMQSHQPLAPSP